MKKNILPACLALMSLGSFAQSSTLSTKGLPVKNALQNLAYIPSKKLISLSYTGSDSVSYYIPKPVSCGSFYINKFEVSNKEYREFVQYVKDSTAHTLLQHFKKGSHLIDWSLQINWKDPLLEPMMIAPDERAYGKREVDPFKIIYHSDPSDQKERVSVYPDTLVWLRDFSYSYNEPLVKSYFSGKSYQDYPVVGVNLEQAMAFCQWKTEQVNNLLKQSGTDYRVFVRLPTDIEWESAAIGNKDENKKTSTGKPYRSNFGIVTDKNGVVIKKYDDDGYFYTSPVSSYPAGANGLYNMKGNVAEWTSDLASEIIIDKNSTALEELLRLRKAEHPGSLANKPEFEAWRNEMNQFIIVKGGGWNSGPFYLQTGACQFFPANATHSFLGFRYVVLVRK